LGYSPAACGGLVSVNDVKVTEEDDSSLTSGVIGMFSFNGTSVFNNLAYFE
jgi:hypothetical protein